LALVALLVGAFGCGDNPLTPLQNPPAAVTAADGPVIYIDPPSYTFDQIDVGTQATQQFAVGNRGSTTLSVQSVAITLVGATHFTLLDDGVSGQTVAPGSVRTLTVAFESTEVQDYAAALEIVSNDPNNDPLVAGLWAGTVSSGGPAPTCDLPYPFDSSNPRTSVIFDEGSILTGVSPAIARATDVIKAFYIDEHALTLGQGGSGHAVSLFHANLDAVAGTVASPNLSVGDPAAVDASGRPLFPALFLTDLTADPSSTSGDWQNGGLAIPPTAVFGTWKEANGPDPAKNQFDVGNGDTVPQIPAGTHDADKQYFSAEVQWQVSALALTPGHTYRVQVMMHDGDQHGDGGDVGQGCVVIENQ